ncbi:MAG: hypothetical protein ABIS18_06815 [Actinomycetota bacterium]
MALPVVVCLSLGACSNSLIERITGTGKIAGAREVAIPETILGLGVDQYSVSEQVLLVDRPYVDSVGLFAMREKDLLRATLQVSHLNSVARPRSEAFRRSIINLMGTSTPIEVQVEKTRIFSTSGNRQSLFVWFEKRTFYVLSVHEDYEFPRTLLREVIGLEEPTV